MAQGQPAAGLDEPGVALGDGHGHARAHQGPPSAGGQHRALARHEVRTRVTGVGVEGQGQVGIEPHQGHLEVSVQPGLSVLHEHDRMVGGPVASPVPPGGQAPGPPATGGRPRR